MEKWSLCQIVYEGVDYKQKYFFESISHGDFLMMTDADAWKFLEDLAEKTMQWEGFNKKLAMSTAKAGIHAVDTSIAQEAKLSAVI